MSQSVPGQPKELIKFIIAIFKFDRIIMGYCLQVRRMQMLVPIFKTRNFCIRKVLLHVLDFRHELFRHDLIGLRPDLVARILKHIIGSYKNRLPFLCIFEEDIISYLVRGGSFSMV
jgi:hypothetical protein